MKRRSAYEGGAVVAAVVAAIAVACSSSTSPHVGTPCPTYSGGSATPVTLAGNYTLVSFCQDTLPLQQGVNGTLSMTVGTGGAPDSFIANLNVLPAPLAGPYAVAHDTITVDLGTLGTFIGTYAFHTHATGDTLFVSGHLPGAIAIVFGK